MNKLVNRLQCIPGRARLKRYSGDWNRPKLRNYEEEIEVRFDGQTGFINSVQIRDMRLSIKQTIQYYSNPNSNSGFYLFDPMAPS